MTNLDKLLSERFSTRAYLPKPVSETLVKELLAVAGKSASGGNMQPWNTYVLANAEKDNLTAAINNEISAGKMKDDDGVSSYPENLKSPYRERRYECGMALYDALGIDRADKVRRKSQWQENYNFFGAPVGLIFTLDTQMGAPQYIDLGIYIQSVMLTAQDMGLNTCAQRSWSIWPSTCAKALSLPDEERVVVGMALGYGDMSAPINHYRVSRAATEETCVFRGF